MADGTRESIVESFVAIVEALDIEWEDYGRPNSVDVESAVSMLQDELDSYDQPAAITLPTARIKVDKDEDGSYNVFFFVGKIDEGSRG
jgi:hypothetical protein